MSRIFSAFKVAVRIHRDELVLVERLIREADRAQTGQWWTGPLDEFVASLHVRLGAASAVGVSPQFVPFLPDEIAVVERAVNHMYGDPDSRRLTLTGRQLLEDLRLRLGHAEALVAAITSAPTTPRSPGPAA